jgi:hypothetical protein
MKELKKNFDLGPFILLEVYECTLCKKNVVFWDVVLCVFIINQRFGGTYRLHLQGTRNNADGC